MLCPTYTTIHDSPVPPVFTDSGLFGSMSPFPTSGPAPWPCPHSLQLRSSDWSSQSASPSQRQPALMHRPLSHMNSPERQGWWEAGETGQTPVSSQSLHTVSRADQKAQPQHLAPPSRPNREQGIQKLLPGAPAPAGTCVLPPQKFLWAWPPSLLLHPAGQTTHSSRTRLTSLHSHRPRHSGRYRGCSGRRHTGTPPGCRGVLALLRLEGMQG